MSNLYLSREEVINENELKELIKKFIFQSFENSLTNNEYKKIYKTLNIKASFGIGGKANVTWIAFLGYDQKVSKGIYPVILFDWKNKRLCIVYGVSATENPNITWDKSIIKNLKKCKLIGGKIAEKYGESFCKNCYESINKNITDDLLVNIISNLNNVINDFHRLFQEIKIEQKNDIKKRENMSHPLNQILYGPPGTGKTYESIALAVEIADKDFYEENKDDRNKIRQRFKELRDLGQIEFVTFHQSFSYEDFVEAIKPDLESNDLKYKIEDGIFKRIADKAKENFENSSKDNYIDFDLLITDFANFVENNKPFSLRKGRNGDVLIEEVNFDMDGNFISFTLGGSVTSKQGLTREIIKRDINNFLKGLINSENDVKPTNQSRSIRHGNALYYFSLYKKIKEFYEKNKEKFIKNKEPLKNYVLIIDEINRGNISKIFGELITLIEKDKRLGKEEELTVRLPYSKEEFGVPNNLYIIGTMNTADKSLVFLDSALRRRFVFKAYYPKPELLKNREIAGMHLTQFLEKINKKIVELLDKDHQIGHSYFMKVKNEEDFKEVLENQILPLLEEYFFDEEDKIKDIFGVDEVKVDKIIKKFKNNENNSSN